MVSGGLDLIIKVKNVPGWVAPTGQKEEKSIPDRGNSIRGSRVGEGAYQGKYESLKKGQCGRSQKSRTQVTTTPNRRWSLLQSAFRVLRWRDHSCWRTARNLFRSATWVDKSTISEEGPWRRGRISVSGDGVEGKQAEGRVEAEKHGIPGRVSTSPFPFFWGSYWIVTGDKMVGWRIDFILGKQCIFEPLKKNTESSVSLT